MARTRRRLVPALAAVAGFVLALAEPAQALRALHVDALSMRADRAHLQVGQVFHLAIHVRVRERVASLDELVVPDVGTMKLEGDERHVTSSAAGTDIVETLTLEAAQGGAFTFNGAYLDAVDARTRKPTRFSADPVRVTVDAPSLFRTEGYWQAARLIGGILIAGLAVLAAVAALIAIVRLRRARRPAAAAAAAPVAPPAPVPPPRTPRDEVSDALRSYRSAPANGSLMRLRGALFAAAGASEGVTLRDALAAAHDQPLRAALVAAESAAFGPAHVRDGASADLIGATEAWLR